MNNDIICSICGEIIQDHISDEYILNGNHLKCELNKIIDYKKI